MCLIFHFKSLLHSSQSSLPDSSSSRRMEFVLYSSFISSKHTQEFRFGEWPSWFLTSTGRFNKRTSNRTKAFHFSHVRTELYRLEWPHHWSPVSGDQTFIYGPPHISGSPAGPAHIWKQIHNFQVEFIELTFFQGFWVTLYIICYFGILMNNMALLFGAALIRPSYW